MKYRGRLKVLSAFLLLVAVCTDCLAGVLVLQGGEEVEGRVMRKTDEYIEVMVGGYPRRYKTEEIKKIRGRRPVSFEMAIVKPQPSEENFQSAIELSAKGNFPSAEKIFQKLQAADPSNHNVNEALNIIHDVKDGRIDEELAIGLFKGAYFSLGQDYRKAVEVYERILESYPDNIEVYYNLAMAYQELGQHNKAIPYFEELSRLKPDDTDVLFNLGLSYFYSRQYYQAIPYFNLAARLSTDNPEVLTLLGLSYHITSQDLKARDILIKAKNIFRELGDESSANYVESVLRKELKSPYPKDR